MLIHSDMKRNSTANDLYCVEWDVKPYSTQLNSKLPVVVNFDGATGMERRETTFTYHMERTRGQIRLEPVKDSASYSKPRGKTRQ